MNGYDFDNTLYRGESPFDFFFFCLKKKKRLVIYLPGILFFFIQYKRVKLPVENLIESVEKIANKIFFDKQLLKKYVEEFWKLNSYKLKQDLIQNIKEEDVIITASPRFLIEGIMDKLNTSNLICTEYNIDYGKIEFVCYGENKVHKFKEIYPDIELESFYTDSFNDLAMMNFAKIVYLVKGEKILEYKKD